MPRPTRWNKKYYKDGVMEVELTSWKYFHDYVRQEMLDYSHYVWRGQRDAAWPLESSLDRLLKPKAPASRLSLAHWHLDRFKLSIRGRRGPHPGRIDQENEWWALGQHQGLATPLLDWTESPFVALYFAFEKPARPPGGLRAIWALGNVQPKNKEIADAHKAGPAPKPSTPPVLEYVRPQQDENARLVSQAGLFTRVPLGDSVDSWIRKNYAGAPSSAVLLRITVPELGRTECLRTLNKMNINHLTLFPDVYGASQHCNKALEIDKY